LCNFTPASVVPESNSVSVAMIIATGASTAGGNYTVTITGTSGSISHSITVTLTLISFQLAISQAFPAPADAGSQQTAKVSLMPSYSGSVNATCDASAFSGQCSITPANSVPISAGIASALTLTVNIPNSAAPLLSNSYNVNLTVTDSSGQPSQLLPLPLTVIQDFAVAALTPSTTQTITAGQSVTYNLSVLPAPTGSSFANTVSLACSGAPVISLCSFTPGSVTPGNSSAAAVLTISTTSNSASISPLGPDRRILTYALFLALPALALLSKKKRQTKYACVALPASFLGLLLLALLLPSCGGGGVNGGGGGGGGGGGQGQGTKPGTYAITVTGTSGALSHAAPSTVTLVVN
jgi:hypothetical protein